MFENRVLRRIFGPKRDEMKERFRKLHNVVLHNLHFSPYIIRIKYSMSLAGYVARIRCEMCTQFLLECYKVRDYSIDLDVNGTMILKWTLETVC
jgi:hypothetical protein